MGPNSGMSQMQNVYSTVDAGRGGVAVGKAATNRNGSYANKTGTVTLTKDQLIPANQSQQPANKGRVQSTVKQRRGGNAQQQNSGNFTTYAV